jgi:HAD superfamily hydrolase (TIGR01662 family)
MIHAVLLDLDDTLLDNDMGRFLPPYFSALGQRMAGFVAPDRLVEMLLASTRVMMQNQDATITNQQAFNAHFFPRLGYAEPEVRPVIHSFYEQDYPKLKAYTRPRPEARPLVQAIFDQGYAVAIATNPMFPLRAIEQRLEWAGVLDFPFKLVTSYENAHFCKPNPRYYREIVDKLGCRPQEAMMVGDDTGNDIEPALQIGLHTYWITNHSADESFSYAGLRGSLAECLAWVQAGGLGRL